MLVIEKTSCPIVDHDALMLLLGIAPVGAGQGDSENDFNAERGELQH